VPHWDCKQFLSVSPCGCRPYQPSARAVTLEATNREPCQSTCSVTRWQPHTEQPHTYAGRLWIGHGVGEGRQLKPVVVSPTHTNCTSPASPYLCESTESLSHAPSDVLSGSRIGVSQPPVLLPSASYQMREGAWSKKKSHDGTSHCLGSQLGNADGQRVSEWEEMSIRRASSLLPGPPLWHCSFPGFSKHINQYQTCQSNLSNQQPPEYSLSQPPTWALAIAALAPAATGAPAA
jgi:hypothetical protein